MVKETVLFGCKREEYICFKKIIIRHRINEKSYTNISYTKIRIIFFFFSIDRIRLLFLKKKFFMTCIVSDFSITFHRSKFLKTSYSLKKKQFSKVNEK